jgi:acetyl-CoA acetyltransferase
MNEVVLARPVRTAIGTYGGSLKSVPAVDVHGHIRDQCRSCANAIISFGMTGADRRLCPGL